VPAAILLSSDYIGRWIHFRKWGGNCAAAAAAAAAVFEGTHNFGRRRRHQDGNRKLDDPGYREFVPRSGPSASSAMRTATLEH